jgi:hypothetical protein
MRLALEEAGFEPPVPLALEGPKTAAGTELSARIVRSFSGEVVNAANYGCSAKPAATAQPDPPERAMGRRWLAVAATALVTWAYAPRSPFPRRRP